MQAEDTFKVVESKETSKTPRASSQVSCGSLTLKLSGGAPGPDDSRSQSVQRGLGSGSYSPLAMHLLGGLGLSFPPPSPDFPVCRMELKIVFTSLVEKSDRDKNM